jgi:DNA-binding transcriptional MocR family regulator
VNAVEQYQIAGKTSRAIAASVERAIREGGLERDEPLPTIRGLADDLDVSPATVASAYRLLRERGLVTGEGRRGTRVAPRPALPTRALGQVPPGARDLTVGLPDPGLLPPLAPALRRVAANPPVLSARDAGDDPELVELMTGAFTADGIPCEALTIVSGAQDGIERALRAYLRPGDRVAIEDPAYPPLRDQLLGMGLSAVPVELDGFGILPESLARALDQGIDALITVPRAQNPTGAALTPERTRDLRALVSGHPGVLVIEDDHAGAAAGVPAESIAASGSRWAVVRSMSKTLSPDLRLAAMTGDPTTIARVQGHQILGPGWVSHLLQRLVVELLRDPATHKRIERAAATYAKRRAALIDALASHGIDAHGRSGLNVWVPLREERPAVETLRDAGWVVASGERFRIRSGPGIRVTVASLRDGEISEIAGLIAAAEAGGRPLRVY